MRALLILLFLTGCATAPHQMVTDLDASTDKYKTAECAQARKIALEYDSNVPLLVGVGVGFSVLSAVSKSPPPPPHPISKTDSPKSHPKEFIFFIKASFNECLNINKNFNN